MGVETVWERTAAGDEGRVASPWEAEEVLFFFAPFDDEVVTGTEIGALRALALLVLETF